MNLIICGLPRSGKTVIGKKIAAHLNWEFIDTDLLIEEIMHRSCRNLFQEKGELFFRKLESEVVASLKGSNLVIALGGGTLDTGVNIRILEKKGLFIYLKTPLSTIWNRLSKDLPAFLDDRDPEKAFYALAEKRIQIYNNVASYTFEEALWEVMLTELFLNLPHGVNRMVKQSVLSSTAALQA